ncbi:TPA: class I SAM-dependent methyltransferase, partial [Staphylococcus aureus]
VVSYIFLTLQQNQNNEYSKDLSRELKFKLYTTNDIICSSLYYNFTLSNISFYGDMKGNEFHENSPRLIVKITK